MNVIKYIKWIVFWVIATGTVIYIDNGIKSYDMRFYHGKDNGAFVQLESIIVLSILFYVIMAARNRILSGLIGIVAGVFCAVVANIFWPLLNLWRKKGLYKWS